MLPTQHVASAFVHANSAHQHVMPADAEDKTPIAQRCLSVRNVSGKANVAHHALRHASIDSAISADAVLSADSAHPAAARAGTPCDTRCDTRCDTKGVAELDAPEHYRPRPSIIHSVDSGNASLAEDINSSFAPKSLHRPVRAFVCERRPRFIAPHFDHPGHASLTAKYAAAAVKPSQRLLTYLMSDVLSRDGELGRDCNRQEAASALKALETNAESTLYALGKVDGVTDRHCSFIASLQRCEKVLSSLDDMHGYSRRSKHSSRRLILERTCTALQGIHKRYDASRQILINAHDRRPHYEIHRGDVAILLHPQNVIHLLRHGAGKTMPERERIADYRASLLEVHRRCDADYAESFYSV